jgi:hypothetical protein
MCHTRHDAVRSGKGCSGLWLYAGDFKPGGNHVELDRDYAAPQNDSYSYAAVCDERDICSHRRWNNMGTLGKEKKLYYVIAVTDAWNFLDAAAMGSKQEEGVELSLVEQITHHILSCMPGTKREVRSDTSYCSKVRH